MAYSLARHIWLRRLEPRIVPSTAVSLVSAADGPVVSTTPGGKSTTSNDGFGFQRSIVSSDGRFSVFVSTAANMVAGQIDLNNGPDIFQYDRKLKTVTLVSHAADLPTTASNRSSA